MEAIRLVNLGNGCYSVRKLNSPDSLGNRQWVEIYTLRPTDMIVVRGRKRLVSELSEDEIRINLA